jgi:hypothetical protein
VYEERLLYQHSPSSLQSTPYFFLFMFLLKTRKAELPTDSTETTQQRTDSMQPLSAPPPSSHTRLELSSTPFSTSKAESRSKVGECQSPPPLWPPRFCNRGFLIPCTSHRASVFSRTHLANSPPVLPPI